MVSMFVEREAVIESAENTAATTLRSRAQRGSAKVRSRAEKARYSGRSKEAARIRVLKAGLRAKLPDAVRDDPVIEAGITRAAELVMLAEQKRAAMIRGEAVDLGDLIRLEGAARRAITDLHLTQPPERAAPAGMDALRAHVAAKGYSSGVMPADVEDDEDEDEIDDGGDDEMDAGESTDAIEAEPAMGIADDSETQTHEALTGAALPSGDDGGSEP
jgi:hypothetical protein